MSSKTGLKLLTGAVALSLAGVAAAATNAGSTGTIFLNIVDTTQNTSLMFDTGLSVSSFNGSTASYSQDLSANANYTAFEATVKSGDSIDYSVVGSFNTGPLSYVTAAGMPTSNGTQGNNAATAIGNFLTSIANPSGGSTFNSSSAAAANDWARGGYEATLVTNLGGVTDNSAIGTPIGFYSIAVTNPSAAHGGATITAQAFQWDLSANGLLTYNAATAVPLPAPLLLLLSGLGLTGLLSRRGSTARGEAVGAMA
jgi:hypothetical protein